MRARPAGPAESSVFHYFARRGPTKEAHRRALNRPDGLLRSVAGQGHGRFLPVTLPRERPDQGKRAAARFLRYPGGLGTHQGRDTGTHQGRDQGSAPGTDSGTSSPTKQFQNRRSRAAQTSGSELPLSVTVRGPGSASARPGPCTGRVRPMPSPGGNTTRPDRRRRQGRSSPAATPASWDGSTASGGRGCSTLTPGRAGWSR